ncbi:hypothetical protein ACA30_13690 [Virgibacillus soli]|nr:hypothetical protein ACA30_13690 [Virgibacillus soli]
MKQKQIPKLTLNDHLQSLHVLMGFSLFGILLVNVISFHSPSSYYNPYEWWQYGDLNIYIWLDIIVQGSFYPIIALVFGYGLVLMMEHASKKGISFYRISVRRLMVLLLIGGAHAFLVWYGDILVVYAFLGLFMLLFLRLRGHILLGIGIGLYFFSQMGIGMYLLLLTLFDTTSIADFTNIAALQQSMEIYSNGTFLEITAQRFVDWSLQNGSDGLLLNLLMTLPLMMIGAGAAKLSWLQRVNVQKKKWFIILLIALPIGVAAKLFPLFTELSFSYQYIQDAIGGPFLGVAYLAAIVLIMTNQFVLKLFQPLSSIGRMSVTIYLMQSIFGTLIFYSYGLGLYGQVSMGTGIWLAVALFVIQVLFAEIWFSRFNQGPLEKLLTLMTNGKNKLH